MQVRIVNNPAEYWNKIKDHLLKDEALNSVPISIINTLIQKPSVYPRYYLFLVDDSELCAIMTPPFHLVLTQGSQKSIEELIDFISKDKILIPGVVGPTEAARYFSKVWTKNKNCRSEVLRLRSFYLTKVAEFKPVRGTMRVASEKDLPVVSDWFSKFAVEAGLPRTETENSEKHAERKVKEGNIFIWEDQKIVSLAGKSIPSVSGARIGPVYTPPELRRRGYAKALVGSLSQLILDQGCKACFLSTDTLNPTSNKIYQEIGYIAAGDFEQISFGAPEKKQGHQKLTDN